jgi:hypothetical protein
MTYPGARALAELHERHLRSFVVKWRAAKQAGVTLPETDDRAYRSFDALLWHVLECACYYIDWSARALGLAAPALPALPEVDGVAGAADRLLEEILAAWRLPLADQPRRAFTSAEHAARWGTHYCVDAMLEHAVMHPLRHEWQLEKLCGAQA